MITTVRTLAAVSALAIAASLMQAPIGGLAIPAHAKKDKGSAQAAETFIGAAPIASGPVRRFLVNPHGEVDALLLMDDTVVKFAPHMSQELTTSVKLNDTVSVRGYRESDTTLKAFVITNESSQQRVVERPPVPGIAKMPKHLRFAALSRLKITGKVARQMRGKKGEVNGVLLDDGTVVRFPPHVAFDLAVLLQTGQTIAVEGLGTENSFGRGIEATAAGATLETMQALHR